MLIQGTKNTFSSYDPATGIPDYAKEKLYKSKQAERFLIFWLDWTRNKRCKSTKLHGYHHFSRANEPLYFITNDDISKGLHKTNLITGEPYKSVFQPSHIEALITTLATDKTNEQEIKILHRQVELFLVRHIVAVAGTNQRCQILKSSKFYRHAFM